MSLETATDQIRAQLPQLAALGYKVKFALNDTGVIFVDATGTPPTCPMRTPRPTAPSACPRIAWPS